MRLKRQVATITGIELRRNIVNLAGTGDLTIFEDLYSRIMTDMLTLMREFIKGNNEYVKENLTRRYYEDTMIKLSDVKYNNSSTITKFRFFLNDTIDTLQQGLLNYIECSNKDLLINQYRQKAEILDDNDKLVQYLESRKRRATIFADKTVTVPVATLKPQYAEYIKRYGVPEGLRFDGGRMREIVAELINIGVLSIAEFIA
jgi:hypothetical protein